MALYEDLSAYYDEVFAPDPTETAFILERVRGRKRLLDIGCATGSKTVLCAPVVAEAVGIDSDEEMVRQAKLRNSAPNILYRCLGMLEIADGFNTDSFDAALCLGNTLVHLPHEEDVRATAAGVFNVLERDGVWIIQVLNYDRIIDEKVDALPRIETEHVIFERRYVWEDGTLHFVTTLEEKASGRALHNNIVLLPLRRNALDGALRDAGFTAVEYYGDYSGSPQAKGSFLTIAVCHK